MDVRRFVPFVLPMVALLSASAAIAQQSVDWSKVPPPAYVPEALRGSATQQDAAPAVAAAPAAPFEAFPGAVAPDAVTAAMLDQQVAVSGKIVSVRPSSGERVPTTLVLKESPAPAVSIVYWPDMGPAIEGGKGAPKPGTMVSARGKLGQYREALQVKPGSPADIRIQGVGAVATTPSAPAAPGDVSASALPGVIKASAVLENTGKAVVLVGTVDGVRDAWNERAPSILTLRDASGTAEVVFWTDTRAKMDAELLKPGTPVVIGGSAGSYRERPQVQLAAPDAIVRADGAKLADQVAAALKAAEAYVASKPTE